MTVTTSNQSAPLTIQEQAAIRYDKAVNCVSVPGEICKFVGVLGAAGGGLLMAASLTTGSIGALFASGGITAALAAAGAPMAALGSIATQTKRNTRINELDAWLKKEGVR